MQRSVGFNRAYHFLTDCPLRKAGDSPLVESPVQVWFEPYKDLFLRAFKEQSYTNALQIFQKRRTASQKTAKKVHDLKFRIDLLTKGLLSIVLFAVDYMKMPVEYPGKFTVSDMEAVVDISRRKANHTIELLWVRFNTTLPDASQRDVLYHYVQWNARAYELKTKVRPHLLTVYFPLIDETIKYIYNEENGLDVVAGLIMADIYYARPGLRCISCRLCPEYIRISGHNLE